MEFEILKLSAMIIQNKAYPIATIEELRHRRESKGCHSYNKINKRHKGRQMSSLYFWLIFYSISAVAEELLFDYTTETIFQTGEFTTDIWM